MKEKKHIDRLFQEGLKDFEATPSDAVWKNIEAKLTNKEKTRIIPIWWRYAGVAALLLLLLTVGGTYFMNTDKPETNTIVDIETKINSNPINLNSGDLNKNSSVITVNHKENENTEKSSQNKAKPLINKINSSTNSSIAKTTDSGNRNNNTKSSNKKSNISNSIIKIKTESETTIAYNLEETNKNSNQNEKSTTLIDVNSAKNIIKNNTVSKSNIEEINTSLANNKTTKENSLTIEEAIDKTKDIIEKEEKVNKWSVTPNAAPVYFNSFGEGSSIDPQFNRNSKTGEINMSYGISTSYALNKKLSIRSGINRVNLGYNTNNIVIYRSVGVSSSKRALQNVSVSNNNNLDASPNENTTENISLVSGENFASNESPESFGASNTSINQSLGFIEVPIEIQYALLNKKLGINVIGGFSSFFLNNNEISSEAESGTRILLGEATNLNKISYSANFGLGLNYQVSKKIDFNLEPMFKYQINTFNNTSGDFKPYFIGVYTGFAIKF
ncbi:hypothetical protein [Thalassobellus sediminis]|uniref:hypothetical protein n=1 Tax=Thalassobellus sediminis TaxID=3367753 RepID=UPI0037BD5DD0